MTALADAVPGRHARGRRSTRSPRTARCGCAGARPGRPRPRSWRRGSSPTTSSQPLREAGLLAAAYCVRQHPMVTFWRRLTRDLREHRKPPLVLVRRGLALMREQRRLVAEVVAAGCTPSPPRRPYAAVQAAPVDGAPVNLDAIRGLAQPDQRRAARLARRGPDAARPRLRRSGRTGDACSPRGARPAPPGHRASTSPGGFSCPGRVRSARRRGRWPASCRVRRARPAGASATAPRRALPRPGRGFDACRGRRRRGPAGRALRRQPLVPRHVVLAVAPRTAARLTPARGTPRRDGVRRASWSSSVAFGKWHEPWFVVLPQTASGLTTLPGIVCRQHPAARDLSRAHPADMAVLVAQIALPVTSSQSGGPEVTVGVRNATRSDVLRATQPRVSAFGDRSPGQRAPGGSAWPVSAERGVPGLDHVGDERQPLVEGQERRLHRVDREPLEVARRRSRTPRPGRSSRRSSRCRSSAGCRC